MVYNTGACKVVKEKHLRFSLRQNGVTICGIGFGLADKITCLLQDQPVDIVYKLDENEWNGQKTIQIKVIDLKPAE
jgi:single-stranded-DNA-specific exonuclease